KKKDKAIQPNNNRRRSRRRLDFFDPEGKRWLLSALQRFRQEEDTILHNNHSNKLPQQHPEKEKEKEKEKERETESLLADPLRAAPKEGEESAMHVLRLMKETHQTFNVVMHALIVHNGHVDHARRYLRLPHGLFQHFSFFLGL